MDCYPPYHARVFEFEPRTENSIFVWDCSGCVSVCICISVCICVCISVCVWVCRNAKPSLSTRTVNGHFVFYLMWKVSAWNIFGAPSSIVKWPTTLCLLPLGFWFPFAYIVVGKICSEKKSLYCNILILLACNSSDLISHYVARGPGWRGSPLRNKLEQCSLSESERGGRQAKLEQLR